MIWEYTDLKIEAPKPLTFERVYRSICAEFDNHLGFGWDHNFNYIYVHEDVMGNTRYHTTMTGQSFAELEYDVWGNHTSPNMLQNNDNGVFIFAKFTGHV